MSLPPLSYSATSSSTARSGCLAEVSDSMSYTSEGQGDSSHHFERNSSMGSSDADGQEDEARQFFSGSGWHDRRVPPTERLKHLCRLLEEHYDFTGGDYYGQCAYHGCRNIDSPKGATQPGGYSAAYMPYLMSIGVDLDFLNVSDEISSDPTKDLIDEAFCHPTSLPQIIEHAVAPISRWEIDWSRPLPKGIHAYWEMMECTRTTHAHVLTRAKPIFGEPLATPRTYFYHEFCPQYQDAEEKVYRRNGFRAVLRRVRGIVTSH